MNNDEDLNNININYTQYNLSDYIILIFFTILFGYIIYFIYNYFNSKNNSKNAYYIYEQNNYKNNDNKYPNYRFENNNINKYTNSYYQNTSPNNFNNIKNFNNTNYANSNFNNNYQGNNFSNENYNFENENNNNIYNSNISNNINNYSGNNNKNNSNSINRNDSQIGNMNSKNENFMGERYNSNNKKNKKRKKKNNINNIPPSENKIMCKDNNNYNNNDYYNNNNFNNNDYNNNNYNNNDYNNNNNINNDYNNNINNDYNNNINNDYNNNISDFNLIEQIGYINAKIGEEPKIGLNNIGATCYMNATLQCLSHTTKLTNYFLSPKNQNYINSDENIFSKSYLEVLKKLWIKHYNNNRNNYSPNEFKNILSQLNPLFQGVAANDSKDLVNFVLEQLHSELNKNKYNNNINNNNIFINQNDEQNVLNYFLEEFKKNQQSIISDIFYGIIETRTECLQCKQNNQFNNIFTPFYSYNFQIINFIIFPLEEIRKTKSEINNFNYNEVNLYDCFDYYEKDELMQGDNQMWCKNCRQNAPAKYSTRIYSSPEYFILILNRGKGNIYNVKLNFTEIIDISRYVQIKGGNNLIYQLYAIVTHLGPSSMSGHFIAFCKSPIDNMWYKYNDSMVDLIGNSFNDIHDFGCPYILFYERQGL